MGPRTADYRHDAGPGQVLFVYRSVVVAVRPGVTAAMARPGPITIVVTFPARNLREYPGIEADMQSGILTERAFLPGTLGDGGIFLLHRD